MVMDALAHTTMSEKESEPSEAFQNRTEAMRMPKNIPEHIRDFRSLSDPLRISQGRFRTPKNTNERFKTYRNLLEQLRSN